MFRSRRAIYALIIMCISPARGIAADEQALTLTLDQALAMARESSPLVLAARARAAEARGRLATASLRLRGNPVLDGTAGRRSVDGETFNDFDIGVMQGLGAAGRRRARIEGAEADVAREIAEGEETARRQARDVAVAFLGGVHARERLALLNESAALADAIAHTAERRLQAGDVATLDVNLATTALARARAEALSAEADQAEAIGTLVALLGLKPGASVSLSGDLNRAAAHELEALMQQAGNRPDVAAMTAAIEQAEADARMARTFRQPEIDVGARYEREEEADIVSGALSISLPFIDRGQGMYTEADARSARLVMERDALLGAAKAGIGAAFEANRLRREAAATIEAALPGIAESERLATRSYETGQISLVDLLIVRGGLQETRRAHLDKLLEAAIAGVELEASAGVLR